MNGLMEAVQQADTIAIGGHVRPDGDCIGSCMGLYGAGNVVLTLASFIILFKIKQRFRVKYFGTVSAEDRKISENLIKRIHCVETANYPFLDDERYDISVKSLNNILNKLAKGNKVYKEWSKSCFNICELIDNSSDKDDSSNAEFNKFMWDLHDLLDRNITDI